MIYTSLDESQRQIRLLHLHPGDSGASDPLHCSFTVASLDNEISFEALSYVWGDATDALPIIVEEDTPTAVPITRNLHNALKSMRSQSHERVIWADALCVNQNNLAERNSQVKLMSDVYGRATCVICYLGEYWEGCDMTMEFMERMGSDNGLHISSSHSPTVEISSKPVDWTLLLPNIGQFFRFPYWSRVWTVQEYLLAQNTILQCGTRTLPGRFLFSFYENFITHFNFCCAEKSGLILALDGSYKERSMVAAARTLWPLTRALEYDSRELFQLLVSFNYRSCQDSRDKIYGLLGLAPDAAALVDPDYTKTTKEVFQALPLSYYNLHKTLYFLSFCHNTVETDMPSWVPNWTCAETGPPITQLDWLSHVHQFNAGGNQSSAIEVMDSNMLRLKGILLDTIVHIAPPREPQFSQDYGAVRKLAGFPGETSNVFVSYRDGDQSLEIAFFLNWYAGFRLETMVYNPVAVENTTVMRRQYQRVNIRDPSAINQWYQFVAKATAKGSNARVKSEVDTLLRTMCYNRRFVRTATGYIGWVPLSSQAGDLVVILAGGRVPYILRPKPRSKLRDVKHALADILRHKPRMKSQNTKYTLVGDAYIHGAMDGEAFEGISEGDERFRSFILV
ncbi:heterokaryon incompatibility protein-domain-containing protein [Phaeosphaeriaceae sp. PMI808]|nr:heterokaryon incompatibility protein-domain-containing protein [Phaeosphaeriaceae sp. PMI808]